MRSLLTRFSRLPSIAPVEAHERLRTGRLRLIDVREPDEVRVVSVAGAGAIPLGELTARFDELDDDVPMAFLCRSGNRSASATRAARSAGLEAVNVRGGVLAWEAAGLPLQHGQAPA